MLHSNLQASYKCSAIAVSIWVDRKNILQLWVYLLFSTICHESFYEKSLYIIFEKHAFTSIRHALAFYAYAPNS